MYQEADRQLTKIQSDLKREALKLDNTGFDELHQMKVTTVTKRLMKRLKKKNEKAFWVVILLAYEMALEVAHKKGYKGKGDDLQEAWMLGLLDDYNYVTGYLYNPEAERKRLRLSEAISTAMEYKDKKMLREQVTRFFNLWYTQTKQYMIQFVDEAETQAWLDVGVEYAKWITAKDERVCSECAPRHGKIYPLKDFPDKPHYNCRCRKVPMPKGWKPNKDTNSES